MKKKIRKKDVSRGKDGDPKRQRTESTLPAAEPTFSRWAVFEGAILAKVKDPEKCKNIIAQRQLQVDDDANEADLVAAYLRQQLREARLDHEKCVIFLTTAEITKWLQEATGNKHLPNNKATPYLRVLAIPELHYSKKNGVPGWVSHGTKAKANQTATVFSKTRQIPLD